MEMLGSVPGDEGLVRRSGTIPFHLAPQCTDLYFLSSIRFYGELLSSANIGVKPAVLHCMVGQVFIAI
jgi:hypothetical protein